MPYAGGGGKEGGGWEGQRQTWQEATGKGIDEDNSSGLMRRINHRLPPPDILRGKVIHEQHHLPLHHPTLVQIAVCHVIGCVRVGLGSQAIHAGVNLQQSLGFQQQCDRRAVQPHQAGPLGPLLIQPGCWAAQRSDVEPAQKDDHVHEVKLSEVESHGTLRIHGWEKGSPMLHL